MSGWQVLLPVAASATILITFVITIIVRSCYDFSKQGTRVTTTEASITTRAQNINKMEGLRSKRVSRIERATEASITTRASYYSLFRRRGSSAKPLFSWADNPSLMADAVENGWSRFAFTNCSSPSSEMDTTWVVREGSIDFMQKIWLNNSGLKKFSSKSLVRTGLPLPGPPLGNPPPFPQVAYFEITILSVSSFPEDKGKTEGEKTKLIQERNFDGIGNSDSFSGELKLGGKGGESGVLIMSVGLTSLSVVPVKFPGSYRGSIGFNSNGSVNLDGIGLAYGSEKGEWAQEEKVIGCGFDPREKKVFFTVDSELVHVAHCKSDEFGSPLYPIIAANADITLLVNLGQSGFSYEPANDVRTPNPCFTGPLAGPSAALGYEDSGELFSMGRIDPGWLNYCPAHSGTNSDVISWHGNDNDNSVNSRSKVNGDGDESEADLFEIVLDVKGKSPTVHTTY